MIRPARAPDAEHLRAIERSAGARFYEVGMAEVAEDEPLSVERLVWYAEAGRSWVATDDHDSPVGYVVVDQIDGCAHIEQISVDPGHQGHGVARALIAEVERWASSQRLDAMTLATFRNVPWNGPLYGHLGWRVLADDELPAGLRALRLEEARHGLNPDLRVCMTKPVSRARTPDDSRRPGQ